MKPETRSVRIWADYDVHAARGQRHAFYLSRDEQRSIRPDLKAIRGVFVPTECIEELRERAAEAVANLSGFTVRDLSAPGMKHRDAADAVLRALGLLPSRKLRS